ncbi:MAG: hypothetical protein AB1847_22600 [bacterium]
MPSKSKVVVETPPPPSNKAVVVPMAGVVDTVGTGLVTVGRVETVGVVIGVVAASRARVVVETPPPRSSAVVRPILVVGTVVVGVRSAVVVGKSVLVESRAEAVLAG